MLVGEVAYTAKNGREELNKVVNQVQLMYRVVNQALSEGELDDYAKNG